MRLLSSASLPRSMRAPCSSPLWDLGLLHPSHLFFLCVIGWIWCFFVYLTSTWLFLFSPPPPLSLHDACVISFSLTHTYTTLLHQILSSSLLTLYIHYEIKSPVPHPLFPSHPNPFEFPHSFSHSNFFAFPFPSPKNTQTTNHASAPFPPPGSTNPSTPTTITAPSPLHNSKQ